MDTKPEQTPEGRLIADAVAAAPITAREAAGKVRISEGRWYQIVRGYQTISKGVYAPVRGPADTIARMALVAGVTPKQLRDVDRDDAATELDALIDAQPDRVPESADDLAALVAEVRQTAQRLSVLSDEIDRRLGLSESGDESQTGA